MRQRRSWLFLVALACFVGGPAPVRASGKDVEKAAQMLRINREAMELFESLEFDLARKQLLEALEIGRKAGLDTHLATAKTHGNLALVYAVGLKDEAKAVEHFRKALAAKADWRPPKEQSTPEVMALFERAQKPEAAPAGDELATEAAAAPKPEAAPKGNEGSTALKCPTAGEVQAGDEVTLKCVAAATLKPASIILFYKKPDQEDFTAVPMRAPADESAKKATWTGRIPAHDVAGKWLPFYFEARDERGEALALSGRLDSPNILTIAGGAADTEAGRVRTRARREPTSDDDSEENPLAKHERARAGERDRDGFFLGLGFGSGGGYAASGFEAYKNQAPPFVAGMAGALYGHVTPELGYYVTPTMALTLQGRHQYIPHDNDITASGAHAILARALFFASKGPIRLYGSVAAGGGEGFRLVVSWKEANGTTKTDTVLGGPAVAGVGGGLSIDLSDTYAWVIETNLLAGFPKFSTVLDVNTGIRAMF